MMRRREPEPAPYAPRHALAVLVGCALLTLSVTACDEPSTARGARAIQRDVLGGIGAGMREREARWRAEKAAEGGVECEEARDVCRFEQGGAWPGVVKYEVVDGTVRTVTHDFDHPSWGDSAALAADAISRRLTELAGAGTMRPDSLVVWRDPATDQVMILGCHERSLTGPCLLVGTQIAEPR